MRIIGGKHKGIRFNPPKNIPARPTTDIAKEGLFNVLYNTFEFSAVKFLDLFGGTGSISYEFASRGCEQIDLVELDRRSVQFIERTAKELQLPIQVYRLDVFKFIKRFGSKGEGKTYDIIFAGPPYPLKTLDTIPDLIFENQLLSEGGWLVLEHNPNHNFEDHQYFHRYKNYGTTIFSIFEMPEHTATPDENNTQLNEPV